MLLNVHGTAGRPEGGGGRKVLPLPFDQLKKKLKGWPPAKGPHTASTGPAGFLQFLVDSDWTEVKFVPLGIRPAPRRLGDQRRSETGRRRADSARGACGGQKKEWRSRRGPNDRGTVRVRGTVRARAAAGLLGCSASRVPSLVPRALLLVSRIQRPVSPSFRISARRARPNGPGTGKRCGGRCVAHGVCSGANARRLRAGHGEGRRGAM